MPVSHSTMIHKLQNAINARGERILYNKTQWYSEKQQRPVTLYVIRKSYWDEAKQKASSVELFKSTSQIQIVLYLRDYWYELNGWEVPTDNQKWLEAKKNYLEKNELSNYGDSDN